MPEIRFLLNDREVATSRPAGTLVLDFLRQNSRLYGTKEGCKEGDCGACVVLVGESTGERIRYRPLTSCLVPLGELQGKHLVTIEGLNLRRLSPVQQAIVDEGATQCGFCTPGIVVSLTGYLMEPECRITPEGIQSALGGHLCRCTGYGSLKQTYRYINKKVGSHTGVPAMVEKGFLPAYFLEAPKRLSALPATPPTDSQASSADFKIAGGTDLYVQQGESIPVSNVQILDRHPEMKGIARQNGHLRVGALTTFEDFARNSLVIEQVPDIHEYMHLIASWQIRNRATLGGNIINASPIGDMTILLLALEAQLVLKRDDRSRRVAMTDFYSGYKTFDKEPDELLSEILIPVRSDTRVDFEKVSKRKCLDIATVNSGFRIRCRQGMIEDVGLAMGGVAPIPLFLNETCRYLNGKAAGGATVKGALRVAQEEVSPISDIRGSSEYKRLLVRQFLIAHFTKAFSHIKVKDFYP